MGVSMDRILHDIRENVVNKLDRKHLINRKDLHNIKAQFGIDGIMRHRDDAISVMSWVAEMCRLEYNPILAFKPQGVCTSTIPISC